MKSQFFGGLDQHFPGNSSVVLDITTARHILKDRISGNSISQTYAGTNRTRINSVGLLEAVAANTPVIDYIGASLEPHLRIEPVGMNLLFNSRFATNGAGFTATATMANSGATGADGVAGSGLLVTDDSAVAAQEMYQGISKAAADSATYYMASVWVKKVTSTTSYPALTMTFAGVAQKYATFVIDHVNGTLTGWDDNNAGNIGSRIVAYGDGWHVSVWATDNGANTAAYWDFHPAFNSDGTDADDATATGTAIIDYGMISTGRIPGSMFIGVDAIGSELVTDGGFAAVTEGSELASGTLTVGKCYKITARTDGDFTAVGSPDNNVGTYFNATGTGAGLLDAGDKVKPVTFTNWTAGIGWAPQAVAGALTGKAQKIAGTASTLSQAAVLTTGKVYRYAVDVTRTAGAVYFYDGTAVLDLPMAASGTYYFYDVANNPTFGVTTDATFAGTVDNISAKEHGSVRTSEAKSISITTPASVLSALADAGTVAIKIRFPFAKTQVSAATNILAFADSATSFLYMDSSGVFTVSDGTNTATNNDAFVADTDYILVVRWSADDNDMSVGLGVPGSVAFDAAGTFDDAFTTTGNTTYIGHTLAGGIYCHWIKIWNKELATAQINSLR